jgi:hypothetical protein
MLKAIRPDPYWLGCTLGSAKPKIVYRGLCGPPEARTQNLQIFGPSSWLFMIALLTCAVRDCERSLSVVVGLA